MFKRIVQGLAVTALAVVLLAPAAEARKKTSSKAYTQAKKECLEENPGMKSKALRKCIKEKKKSHS